MASIFLSYARDDAARAGRIAVALEAAGHNVWWDRHIGAGARFGAEIEEALRTADRVVVLWSKASVRSAWVLDEAAAGRDSGRLVPVLIDKVEPPLGFRQYQAIDLSGGRRGANALAPLIEAVGGTAPGARAADRTPPRTLPWKPLLAVLAAMLLVGAGWWLLSRRGSSGEAVSVSLAAGNSDPRSAELARSIALDLSSYRAGPLGSLTILDPSDKSGAADYQVDVTASGDSSGVRADVAMRSRDAKGLLWSTSIEGEGRKMVDIRQQAAANLGDVLNCLVEVRRGASPPSHEVLGLYLAGCAAEIASVEADSIFRSITAKAPNFAPGWAGLALVESNWLGDPSAADDHAARTAALHHLALARRIDPQTVDGYVAEANLVPVDRFAAGKALDALDRGLAAHPDSALLHGTKSRRLQSVGRMTDGVEEAQQAAELNPVSPGVRDALVSALAFAGRTREAFGLLDKADRTWPGSDDLANTRYVLNLRFGDPAAALEHLRQSGAANGPGAGARDAWAAFIQARMDPSPARIAQALDAFRARNLRHQGSISGYVQALGTFGRVDEFFEIAANPDSLAGLRAASEVLFRTHMQPLRADPRFIALTKRIGLLDYWQRSGQWPDFCSDPQLPYNCKAEAAKLAGGAAPRG